MEKNLSQDEIVSFHCPNCERPYTVETFLIKTSKPLFQCVSCQNQFYFLWPQPYQHRQVATFAVEDLSPEKTTSATETQERIEAPIEIESELTVPQPVPLPLKRTQETLRRATETLKSNLDMELEALWKNVTEHWDDDFWHQSFLSLCDRKKNLSFAAGKYSRYMGENPLDEIAKRMKGRLKALAETELVMKKSVRSHAARTPTFRLSNIVLVLAVIMMVIGFSSHDTRNLVGVGAAFAVIALGLRYFLSNTPNR